MNGNEERDWNGLEGNLELKRTKFWRERSEQREQSFGSKKLEWRDEEIGSLGLNGTKREWKWIVRFEIWPGDQKPLSTTYIVFAVIFILLVDFAVLSLFFAHFAGSSVCIDLAARLSNSLIRTLFLFELSACLSELSYALDHMKLIRQYASVYIRRLSTFDATAYEPKRTAWAAARL